MEDKTTKRSRMNTRGINEIYKYAGEFYMKIIDERGGFCGFITEAYEGFEHFPEELSFKVPNITRIWNLPCNSGGFMYGSSMGHMHDKYEFDVQEIYEFDNFGGMLIADNNVKLYVCKPRDKVIVGPNCMMTILNLSFRKLETLDMANPLTNGSSKEIVKEKGPMIALYHTGNTNEDRCPDFSLSSRFNQPISLPTSGVVIMRLNKRYEQFGIRDDVAIEFDIDNKEDSLLENILRSREELAKYNIEVVEGNRVIECVGRDGRMYCLDGLLGDIARGQEKKLHKMLGMIGDSH